MIAYYVDSGYRLFWANGVVCCFLIFFSAHSDLFSDRRTGIYHNYHFLFVSHKEKHTVELDFGLIWKHQRYLESEQF